MGNGLVKEIEILPHDLFQHKYKRCYLIKSKSFNVSYIDNFKLKALKNGFPGFIDEIARNKYQVVLASDNKDRLELFVIALLKELEDSVEECK